MTLLNPKIKYWVNFHEKLYNKPSKMFHRASIPATSLKDAKGWVKTFKEDKRNSNFEIEKVGGRK